MKISDNFDLREFIHPEVYKVYGDLIYEKLNVNLVPTIQDLRNDLGVAIKINDWHTGGAFVNSGLRSPKFPLDGKGTHSRHYFGYAADLKFSTLKPEYVYYHILDNQVKYPFISRIEQIDYTPTWLHIETQTAKREGDIYVFNPY